MPIFIILPISLLLICAGWYYKVGADAGLGMVARIALALLGAALFLFLPEIFMNMFPDLWRDMLRSSSGSDAPVIAMLFLACAAIVLALGLPLRHLLRGSASPPGDDTPDEHIPD